VTVTSSRTALAAAGPPRAATIRSSSPATNLMVSAPKSRNAAAAVKAMTFRCTGRPRTSPKADPSARASRAPTALAAARRKSGPVTIANDGPGWRSRSAAAVSLRKRLTCSALHRRAVSWIRRAGSKPPLPATRGWSPAFGLCPPPVPEPCGDLGRGWSRSRRRRAQHRARRCSAGTSGPDGEAGPGTGACRWSAATSPGSLRRARSRSPDPAQGPGLLCSSRTWGCAVLRKVCTGRRSVVSCLADAEGAGCRWLLRPRPSKMS